MYRKSYYRSYKGKYGKYSNETIAFNQGVTDSIDGNVSFPESFDPQNPQTLTGRGLLIVPATDILGNRKVKNFTLKLKLQIFDHHCR